MLASTVASIVTFVMVFVIQYSRNRDSRATQARLDAIGSDLAAMVKQHSLTDHEYPLNRLAGLADGAAREVDREQARMRQRPDDPRTNRPEAG